MSKWSYSSISDHKEHCKENIHWSSLTVLGNQTDKTKHKWNCDLKVFEALEIQQKNCGSGLNEDYVNTYVKTVWNLVFSQMDKG